MHGPPPNSGAGGVARLPRLLLFLSGACALVLETLWMRSLTDLFGASAPAVAATLCAVFAGFAAGSAWSGGRARRWRLTLAAYGWLELLAALTALAAPFVMELLAAWMAPLHARFADAPALLLALRLLVALVAVFPPAFFLGGTLPAAVHAIAHSGGDAGRNSNDLYRVNTIGAVVGALAVPFLLLPTLGRTGSYAITVAMQAAIGAIALFQARRAPGRRAPVLAPVRRTAASPPIELGAVLLAFGSGAATLAAETAFARLFAQVHESSVHSFAIVLALFLAALFVGSFGARVVRARKIALRGALTLAWLAAGLLLLGAPLLFVAATDGLCDLSGSFARRSMLLLTLGGLVLFPPVVAAGMAFPLLLEARAGGAAETALTAQPAKRVGRLLGANHVGSIVGPLLTNFILFPWIGLYATFRLLGGLFLAAALAASFVAAGAAAPRWRTAALAVAALGVALGFVRLAPPVHVDRAHGETLVAFVEGAHGIAAVLEDPHGKRLKLDNTYTLSGTGSTGDSRQLGHLPLLLHPAPQRVAFLGLGTGITAGAAVSHRIEALAIAELVPEVTELARTHFAAENQGVLDDPRTRVVNDDARTFLRTNGGFDVIVGDLVVPWRAGESALYTREHFLRARASLAPGGLFCQWLPVYQMSEESFDIVVATFLDVFPTTTLWRGDFVAALPTLGLVGHLEATTHEGVRPLDPAVVDAATTALAPRLDRLNPYLVHPAGLWLYLVGVVDPRLARFTAARRNSLDRPWLELGGPLGVTGAAGRNTSFAPARLDALLELILGQPLAGTLLRDLDAEHLGWRDAGARLWRASRMVFDDQGAQARRLALETLDGLPKMLRDAVLDGVQR